MATEMLREANTVEEVATPCVALAVLDGVHTFTRGLTHEASTTHPGEHVMTDVYVDTWVCVRCLVELNMEDMNAYRQALIASAS